MDRHVTRREPYWKSFFAKPIQDRVFIAPREVIEYIDLDNRKIGLPNRPTTPTPSKEFLQDIRAAIEEIPPSIKKLMDRKFAGIFLVNDLGGTGYTNYILNENNDPISAFVVLDANVLQQRKANEWATWKERTPFKAGVVFDIEAVIEDGSTDNRKNAIQYILLHELGHVASVSENIHPVWEVYPNDIQNVGRYSFFNESWKIDREQNKFTSRFDSSFFSERTDVIYYFGAKLNNGQIVDVYNKLEKTNFATLYAATHPSDDWAESFVTYVHGVLMKKPFRITIKKNGKAERVFELCWGKPRCEKKKAILDQILRVDKDNH